MLSAVQGKLILCATPIGNLGDTSDRLQAVLADADIIYAEDTRRASKLLRALGVRGDVRSYFVGNEDQRSKELVQRLRDGETVALITDAGMPAIADPGVSAVRAAVAADAAVSIVPGPSAATAAIAVSGFASERFIFEGFLPRRGKEREARLAELAEEQRTAILFSGKAQVVKDLAEMANALGERRIVIARELTKAFEEIWRGTLAEAAEHWGERELRGEFTLVLEGAEAKLADLDRIVAETLEAIELGESMADAVRRIAADSSVSRRDLYEAVLRTKE